MTVPSAGNYLRRLTPRTLDVSIVLTTVTLGEIRLSSDSQPLGIRLGDSVINFEFLLCALCKLEVHENDLYTGIPDGCKNPTEHAGISTHTLYKHRVVWHKKCFEKDGCKCCRYDNYVCKCTYLLSDELCALYPCALPKHNRKCVYYEPKPNKDKDGNPVGHL